MGLAVVLALRLALPLTVLRSPFWGALLTIAADAVDILIFQMSDFPAAGYHRADKALDAYYITVELVAAQRWANLPRVTATALWSWRMVGVFVFEISGARLALVFFPNLFEFYFLLIAGLERFKPDLQLTGLQNARWLVLLLIPKLAQEYVLHYARWLDRWVALEIIEDVIDFVLRRK